MFGKLNKTKKKQKATKFTKKIKIKLLGLKKTKEQDGARQQHDHLIGLIKRCSKAGSRFESKAKRRQSEHTSVQAHEINRMQGTEASANLE